MMLAVAAWNTPEPSHGGRLKGEQKLGERIQKGSFTAPLLCQNLTHAHHHQPGCW